MPLPATMIRVDIDPDEVNLNYPIRRSPSSPTRTSTADALVEALRQRGAVDPKTSADEVAGTRASGSAPARSTRSYYPYIEALRDAMPRDGIIVQDMTMMSYRMNDAFPVLPAAHLPVPVGYGTLGFSVPAAIGAKIGKPDTPVVADRRRWRLPVHDARARDRHPVRASRCRSSSSTTRPTRPSSRP